MAKKFDGTATKQRAMELMAAGHTSRSAVATMRREGLPDVPSHMTLERWKASPEAPGSEPGQRKQKREGEEDLPPELQGLNPEAMDLPVLTELDRQIGERVKGVEGDSDETKVWIALVRLRMDLRSAMAKMRPRAVVDPDEDPLSLAARDLALAKIKKALAAGGGV